MSNFVRVLIDTDPEELRFKVLFDLNDSGDVTVEFRKNKKDCINLTLADLENLGYADAKRLLQAALASREKQGTQ